MKTIIFCLVGFLLGISAQYYVNRHNYKKIYKIGIYEGFDYCIDTINTVLQNQTKSDSTVTKATFESEKDTFTYYFSKKMVNEK